MDDLIDRAGVRLCVHRAAVNWLEWQDCFGHSGRLGGLPVLADDHRFGQFAHEYGLRWLGDERARSSFRRRIRRSKCFEQAVRSANPSCLDRCIERVRSDDGSRQMSAVSKLAAFAAPESFIPTDRYSRQGLVALGAVPGEMATYTGYLRVIGERIPKRLDDLIESEIRMAGLNRLTRANEALRNRVLDIVLMSIGGRWGRPGA
jgi:hypothetical protein